MLQYNISWLSSAPASIAACAGLGVDLSEIAVPAVARGVHVRAGLEDAPFGEARSNAELIADVVRKVEAAGGRPASVAEVRAMLAAIAAARN